VDRSVFIVDNTVIQGGPVPSDFVEYELAHELGHILNLGHGNGIDDEGNSLWDARCDSGEPNEDVETTPITLMRRGNFNDRLEDLQRERAQVVAQKTPGYKFDPPPILFDGDVISDHTVDRLFDVTDESIDLVSIRVTQDSFTDTTTFSHKLFGVLPVSNLNHRYSIFLDLDNDPGTGGTPSDLGFPTAFRGAELVTSVSVSGLEFRTIDKKLWKFETGTFVLVVDPSIEADVVERRGIETDTVLNEVVSIRVANAIRGAVGVPIRLQAIAEQRDTGALDRVPGPLADAGTNIALVPPRYPSCAVAPSELRPGQSAVVEASGLVPGAVAHGFLGDEAIGEATAIDAEGNVQIPFRVPLDARDGLRLVTVGVGALSADCSLRVTGAPFIPIDIKPGACPNPWNRNGRGILTVAVSGTEDFDVTDIDLSTLVISRADGEGGTLAPNEGPPGPHPMVKDIATAFAPADTCDCEHLGADGIPDLSLPFRTNDLVRELDLGDLPQGAMPELLVSGTLFDGTPFSGSDCVRLVPPGTPPNMLQVSPNAAGAWIDVAPLDEQLDGGGFGLFQRTYPQDTEAVLTAEPEMNRRAFLGWRADGGRLIQTDSLTVRVNGHIQTVEAVYEDPPRRCGLGWELGLLVPPLLWLRARRRRTAM
jgi:hypothetical protein